MAQTQITTILIPPQVHITLEQPTYIRHRGNVSLFFREKTGQALEPGGGGTLNIYWWGGAAAHPKRGVLGTGTTQKGGGGLGTGTTQKRGVLGTGTSRKRGVLGTGTSRKRGV